MTKTRTLPIDARSYSRWVTTKARASYYQNHADTAATGFLPQGVSLRLLARLEKKRVQVWTPTLAYPIWVSQYDLEVVDLLTPEEVKDKLRAHPRHHCMSATEYQFNVKVRKAFPIQDNLDLTDWDTSLVDEVMASVAFDQAREWFGYTDKNPTNSYIPHMLPWLVPGSARFEGRMGGHLVIDTTFDVEDKLNTLEGYLETFEATWTQEVREGCQTNLTELIQTMTLDYHEMWKLRAELSTFARDIDALAEWTLDRANSTYLEAVRDALQNY